MFIYTLLSKIFRITLTTQKATRSTLLILFSIVSSQAQITGTVFRDFNGNGTKDTNEPLVAGVTVNAYLANSSTPCGTVTTSGNTSPNFSLSGCGLDAVRVEFTLPTSGLCANSSIDFASFAVSGNATSVQFVNGNTTNVNFAIHNPTDYNTGTTGVNVFVPCYVSGDPLPANSKSGAEAWFVGYPYTNSGGSSLKPTQMIGGSTLGATWGVAYSKQAKKIFTSAFLKRHVGLGKLGSGGIYLLTPTATSFTVSEFYDLDANGHRTRAAASAPAYGKGTSYAIASNSIVTYLGTNDPLTGKPAGLGVIGTNAERGLSTDPLIPTYDPAAFDQIGKVGLGDIDISDDGKFLFVMNLYSRKVFRLELNNASNPTSVVNVTSYDIPATTCTNGEYRPFGLKFSKNKLYVGVVCSGENSGTAANLNATVYELMNPTSSATFNPTAVLFLPLNFNRTGDWRPWVNNSNSVSTTLFTFPTPLLSDIEFTDRGDMILAFMDRSGHQWGFRNRKFLETQTTSMEYNTGGDVLIAGLNCNTGTFTIENNGSVNTTNGVTLTGTSTVLDQAPGGKEFFDDDSDVGDPSEETVFGAAAVLKGLGEVLLPAYAISLETSDAGTMKLSTTNGSFVPSSGYVLYSNNGAAFGNSGKANGLGDVELSTPTAPIEIGNRIWKDTDKDGIQDAGEEGIDGVVIELYEGTAATASPVQTVTSATNGGQKGTWYFTNLKANQDYVIKVKTALGTGALATCNAYSPTGAGTILIDNNTSTGTISLQTGNAGENNHSFDIGVNEGCVKPNAGADQTLTCINGNPPSSFDLVDAAAGQKWKIISPVPAGASISVLTPSGAVSGTIVAGVYKFRLQTQSDSVNCADTVQVTVPNCTSGSDPICFSSSRVVSDNKLGAVCNPPVTPDLFYSFYMIFKNTSGTFDRFKTTDLKFEEYCDGTAKIYGTVCSIINSTLCLDIVYNLSGRTTIPPSGSPYAGICNTSTGVYYYYTGGTGTLTGKSGGGFNNFSATIVRDGAAFQVGVGANTNENVFGASGWIKPTIMNAGDGNWTIEVEPTSGVVHGDFNINLSDPTPLYNLTATSSTVCQGQTATLTANLPEKCTVTYTWTGPNGFTATGANVNVPNAVAGTYTVKAEITSISGAKCNKTATAIIVVNPKPTVAVVNGFPACRANGTAYSIKFTKAPAGAVVTAKNIATGASIAITGDSIANIPLIVAKVRLIVTNGACKDSVEVNAPTCLTCVKPNAGPDQQLVCGTTVPTTANLVDAATGQKWKVLSAQPNTTVTVTTPAGAVSGMTAPGIYKFVLQTQSDSLACRDTVWVTVPDCSCPIVNVLTPNTTVCKDSLFPILGVSILGKNTTGVGAAWYANATGGNSLGTGLNFKPAGVASVTDTFYVQLTGISANCQTNPRTAVIVKVQNCTVEVDLALKKFINTKIAKIGDVMLYTLKVWNQSNKNATGVEVSDSIATTVQFQAGSFIASRGSATINGNVIKWNIGNIAAAGDTVTLTYRVKATQEGVHFNTAEICKTNEKDVDSTPCNHKDEEDDIDRQCFTVPIKLCPGEKVELQVPSILTNVQWFKNGSITPIATGNSVLLSDVGTYTYTAINQTCPANGCCPVIIEEGVNCCPVNLCIPYTIKKKRK